ncbi:ribosomal protein L7/L12 [Nocardia pseudovaccinii]|uniref:ribosomal protein L7/L12 n=1 Tax=Nocardia pseudovaccinii TaxID=189540 RepID=UPI0007A3E8E1|nr:ribosomal protein L7/L12 [Nocardia pseudovaccinii]
MFDNNRLERRIDNLERKLDMIIKHLGLPSPDLAAPYDEIDELIRQGKKIHAIKLYRDLTGASLKDAKDAVEARERHLQ